MTITMTQQLAIQVFENLSPGSLRACIPILSQVTSWLARLEQPISLPGIGQNHEPARHAANVYTSSLALFAKVDASAIGENPHSAIGAFFHDIGMTGRLQDLAGRPGELKFAEHALIRQHTLRRPDQIAEGTSLDPAAVDVIRHHHERIDGTGYPEELVGDSISIPARTVAITSAFNALTSKIPRRPAYSAYKALAIMGRDMARHFDPNLLREFVGILG